MATTDSVYSECSASENAVFCNEIWEEWVLMCARDRNGSIERFERRMSGVGRLWQACLLSGKQCVVNNF